MVELSVKCKGCGKRKTFSAPDAKTLNRMVAESGWVIDGSRAECQTCYLAVQHSYEDAAGRRSW